MQESPLLKETINSTIKMYYELTQKVLTTTPGIDKQYSSLDPMLKINLDQNFLNPMSILVRSLFESLKIYSILSKGNKIQKINSESFFKLAAAERKKIEEFLKEKMEKCLHLETIKQNLQDSELQNFENEIKGIRTEFNKINLQLNEESEKKWKAEENRSIKTGPVAESKIC